MLVMLVDTQIWHLTVSVCWNWGGLNKVPMSSASTSLWNKASLTALPLEPDNLVPPHMSLILFELLSQC